MALSPGSRVGTYEVTGSLGAGGMGEVYRAHDTKLDRDVALKILPESFAADPDRLMRFEREAKTLAALNHQHIAQIYGVDDSALIMELVEGEDLAERIARGPIPLDEALPIARQIADALDTAHEHGIIHRDLKPANIKVRADGTVKVLDFGLAKIGATGATGATGAFGATGAVTSPAMTQAGLILGTAAYMSPEQARGKPVDRRADIWAFGCLFYEMLSGRRAFDGDDVTETLTAIMRDTPKWEALPAETPSSVRRLLARCIERDPKKRLRDIGDAMSLLDDAEPSSADATAAASPRWLALTGWVAAIALGLVMALMLWTSRGPAPDVDPPSVRFQIARANSDVYGLADQAFAVSPDGQRLAYYDAGSDGQPTLFVRSLATGEIRSVPGSQVVGPSPPFWSANSDQIAFSSQTESRVFDVVSGATRRLCVCRFGGGAWNRDGVILLGSLASMREGIRQIRVGESGTVAVTTPDANAGDWDGWPVFLPDGRFLFTRTTARDAATYASSRDGSPPTRVGSGSRDLFIRSISGVPYLLRIDASGFVAQTIDIESLTVRGEVQVIVPEATVASVSDNGVLATSAAARRPITRPTWFDRKGTVVGTIGDPGGFQSVDLSPDGRKLALSGRLNGQQDVWLRDLTTGAFSRLTFSEEEDTAPVWSPDGTRIVTSSRKNTLSNLYERATDGTGSESRIFPSDSNEYANDWSPDGQWVIFTLFERGNTDLDLWVVSMTGADRKAMPYLSTRARESQAVFSPDGRFVAYTSNETGTPEVYVQPFPNAAGGKWMISNGGGVQPRWGRDGTELFYFAGRTLMATTVSLRPTFSAGVTTRLFDAPIQPGYVNDADRWQVAADGKRFLLLPTAGDGVTAPIDVIVNWEKLVKR